MDSKGLGHSGSLEHALGSISDAAVVGWTRVEPVGDERERTSAGLAGFDNEPHA
jgi:hypothetical protein